MPQTETKQRSTFWKYASLLAGFAIVCVGIFLLSRTYRIDRSEYYPLAFVILVAAAGVTFLRMRLNDLRRERKLHGFILKVSERGIVAALMQLYVSHRRFTRGPMVRMSILAGVVFLVVWVLAWNNLLFDQNLYLLEQFYRMGQARPDEITPVRELFVMTEGRGTEERLKLMLKVTKDLVNAGAKIVVLELPAAVPQPYYNTLLSQINATGDVVFAVENEHFYLRPISWSTRNFFFAPWAPDSSVKSWGLITGDFGQLPPYHRSIFFVPDGYVHNHQFESDTTPDVTIEVLRKWGNYPRTMKPIHRRREVEFGEYRIPVSSAGLAICPMQIIPPPGYLASIAADNWKKGNLEYRWMVQGEDRSAEDLNDFEQQIRGMIMIVPWSDPVERRNVGYWETPGMYVTSMILNDALHKRFLEVQDDIHIPLTFIVLLVSVVLIRRVRPLVSVPILVLLGALMVFGSGWLFWERLTIIEVIYPLAGLALCILLLPLAKISVEIQESEIQSLAPSRTDLHVA